MGLRKERLSDQIRDLVANCLSGGKMGDPRLQFVTITAVHMSGDLQIATVYFRSISKETQNEVLRGLISASGYFRTVLAKALSIRRAPVLRFQYDKSIENGSNIEKLLDVIHRET